MSAERAYEAGHAVIARVLHLRCGEATIEPNENEGYWGYSHTGDPWNTVDDWDRVGRYRNHDVEQAVRGYILVCMAGAEAEIEILGHTQLGDGHDRQWVQFAAMSSDSGFSEEEWPRYEPRLRRQARHLVRKHRDKIELVAKALLERSTLSKVEIDEACA